MLGPTHRAFGFAASTAVLVLTQEHLPAYENPSMMTTGMALIVTQAAALLSSTLPDMDQKLGMRHRGLTHAVWIPCIFGVLSVLWRDDPVRFSLVFGILLGWFFHLFGDAFSKAGVAWFYPFQTYQYHSSGAFYVKGNRGLFRPLYSVGDSAFSFLPALWWIAGILLTILLWGRI